jgi:hypothetical protein
MALFAKLGDPATQPEFWSRVADDVDWTVKGTHPLAGRYHHKAEFVWSTFARLAGVLAGGVKLRITLRSRPCQTEASWPPSPGILLRPNAGSLFGTSTSVRVDGNWGSSPSSLPQANSRYLSGQHSGSTPEIEAIPLNRRAREPADGQRTWDRPKSKGGLHDP